MEKHTHIQRQTKYTRETVRQLHETIDCGGAWLIERRRGWYVCVCVDGLNGNILDVLIVVKSELLLTKLRLLHHLCI